MLILSERRLLQDGAPVALTPKAFDLLVLLASRKGEVVDRADVLREVWGDVNVEESVLTQNIFTLRKALGAKEYIETVPRRGYRFSVPVIVSSPPPDSPPFRSPTRRSILYALGATGLAVGGGTWLWSRTRTEDYAAMPVAVLPFKNLTGDASLEFLSDGIADQIGASLARSAGVKVVARLSAFQFKSREASLADIASQLSAELLVEGSLRQQDGTYSVNVQMVRVSDGYIAWSETFVRPVKELFILQNDVAAGVIRKIAPNRTFARLMPPDSAGYEAYLRGRYFLNKQSADGYKKAISYFEETLRLEPEFAPAHAGLADTYWRSALWEAAPPTATYVKAKESARLALELDPESPDAHASLGSIHLNFDWDWAAAEKQLLRALEIHPGHANAHHWLSHLYVALGQFGKSLEHSQTAYRVEPLDMPIGVHIAWHYYYQRDFDATLKWLIKAEEQDPTFAQTYHFRAMALIEMQRTEEAIDALEKSLHFGGQNPERIGWLGYAHALRGNRNKAEQILADLANIGVKRYVSPHSMALVRLGLGEAERALDLLEIGFRERSSLLTNLRVEPAFDPLRRTPRFEALQKQMHFPA